MHFIESIPILANDYAEKKVEIIFVWNNRNNLSEIPKARALFHICVAYQYIKSQVMFGFTLQKLRCTHLSLRRQSPCSLLWSRIFGSGPYVYKKLHIAAWERYVQSVIIVACDGEEVKLACVSVCAQIETSHAAHQLGESICIISGAGGATSGAHSGQQNLRVDRVHAALHVELAWRSALAHLRIRIATKTLTQEQLNEKNSN